MTVAVRIPLCENHDEPFFDLVERICHAASAVAEDRLDFSELHEQIMQLENVVFRLDEERDDADSIIDRLEPEAIAGVRGAYSFWESRLERQFADRLLRSDVPLSAYTLFNRLDGLIRRERALLSIGGPRRLLFIGSGPLPISAILLYLQTGWPVDCLAHDSDAVPLARKVLERCGLGDSLRILGHLEEDCDLSTYDAVLIDTRAKRKKTILKGLRKRCRTGCEVLCRTSSGLRRLLHESISERDLRGFHVKKRQIASGQQTVSTCLVEAAKSAAGSVNLEWLHDINSQTASQILQLMNRTLEEETTIGFPGPIDEEVGQALMRQLRADVMAGHRHVLVAEKDGAIVGQLILTPNSSPNHRHIVELTRGTIDPSFRGGGLSLRAFQEVARKCDDLGREVICLDVRAGTMAALWWQHFGFKPYGLLPDYSRVGNKKYKGLYLTQTTTELKQRLNQLLSMPDSGITP